MAAATRVTVTWGDRYGNHARIVFYMAPGIVDPTDGDVQAVITAINYFLRASALTIELSQVEGLVDTAGTGAYANVEDKMITSFLDSSNAPHNWKIPGIKAALLATDKETLLVGDATVDAWIAAVIANAMGSNGEPIASFSGGHRSINRKLTKG